MKYVIALILLATPYLTYSQSIDTTRVTNGNSTFISYNRLQILEDKTSTLPFSVIQHASFKPNKNEVPNFNLSGSSFWIKMCILNSTGSNRLLLRIPFPNLDSITCYAPDSGHIYRNVIIGENIPFQDRKYSVPDFIFDLHLDPDSIITVYLKIKSKGQMLVPAFVGPPDIIMEKVSRDGIIFGIYIGVILVMLLYNLFIYFSTRDTNYAIYVIYILAVGITQACLKGFGYRYLWHNSMFITNQSVFWCGAFSGIASIVFVKFFLHTRSKLPLIDKILVVFIFLDSISIILSLLKNYYYSYQIINTVALLGAIMLLVAGIALSAKGYRPAKFYLIAWSFFLTSVVIYVLETFSVVPYNLFTQNILLIGSAIEAVLLSFALADKINTFKKEKEESQALALRLSQQREIEAKEQTLILDRRVKERTAEVQRANEQLTIAMANLKNAQSQLVQAEKMSSLGQLTAGIAHEINNPINFVKSNIRPLQLDINELLEVIKKYEALDDSENIAAQLSEIEKFKQKIDIDYLHTEIQSLIKGIEEGAVRTADIVKGLRTFSRLDEDELKHADLHAGLDATLALIRNNIPGNIQVLKNHGGIPEIECYPGKLNQVFMNILTNAVHAIKSKPEETEEFITITTRRIEDHIQVSILDTGIGMTPETREKIFEPFFTTKDVGEGTGLGLSIAFNIIEKHHGTIEVNTVYGKGSEFIITLPITQEIVEQKNEPGITGAEAR